MLFKNLLPVFWKVVFEDVPVVGGVQTVHGSGVGVDEGEEGEGAGGDDEIDGGEHGGVPGVYGACGEDYACGGVGGEEFEGKEGGGEVGGCLWGISKSRFSGSVQIGRAHV